MKAIQITNGIYTGSAGRKSLFDLQDTSDWNKRLVIFVNGFMGFKDWGAWHLVQSYFVSHGFAFAKFNLTPQQLEQSFHIIFGNEGRFACSHYALRTHPRTNRHCRQSP
jgi:hypothetical protein